MNVWIPLLLSAYVAAAIWITWEVLGRPATATGQRVARGRQYVSVDRQAAGNKAAGTKAAGNRAADKEVAPQPEPVEPAEPGPAEPEAPETDEAAVEPAHLRDEPELVSETAPGTVIASEPQSQPEAEVVPEPVFDPLRDPLTGEFADPALWPGTEQLPRLTDDLLAELDRIHRLRESGGGPALAGGARSAR